MAVDPEHQLALIAAADQRLFASLTGLTDRQAREPSALPGWSRGHLLTHLARNADGLCNLLRWARTGVVTPMYREPDGRAADIEAGSSRPADELIADLRDSARRWARAAAELSDADWQAMVRRRSDTDPEPAGNLLDGRLFEVEFHHVDLDLGYRFADSPGEVLDRALTGTHRRLRPDQPFVAVADGQRLIFPADHPGLPALAVHGSAHDLLGWLTGRQNGTGLRPVGGELPELPAW